MAEADDTTPAPGIDYSQLPAILARLGLTPPAPPQQSGQQGQGGVAGFLGDVGKALAGGGSGLLDLAPGESDKAGAHALLGAGINMLLASGPSYVPRGLGEIIGYGLQGAQEGYGGSELATAQRLAAQQAGQQQQYQDRLAAVKEALPLLTTEYQQKLLAAQRRSALGQTAGGGKGSIADYVDPVTAMPREKALDALEQRESGGKNIETQLKNPDGSPASTASGNWQILDSTWQEGTKLVGGDATKYARAIDAPKDVQRQVAGALYDKYGAKPWAASAPGRPTQTASTAPSGKGVAARTGGTDVAGPAAGPAAPAASGGDLVGPRPLPPIGPKSPVVTPESLANTPAPAAAAPPTPPAAPEGNYLDPDKPFIYTPGPLPPGVVPPRELSPQQKSTYAGNIADINRQIAGTADPKELATLQEKRRAVLEEQQKAADAQQKLSQETENKLRQDELASQRAMHEEAVKQKNAAALEAQRGRQAIDLEQLKTGQQVAQKVAEPILAKADAAQSMLKNAQNLELFARQQGSANALWSTDFGKNATNWIVALGGNSEWAKEAAARQSWDTLVNGMFNDVHVPGMGAQSDRETGFLMSQWGGSSQTPLDRMTQLAIIRKNAEARIQDGIDVQRLIEKKQPASDIHEIRKSRQVFDRPPQDGQNNANVRSAYNASHPMGEPYVTWQPKTSGGAVLRWARNTGDPNNPIELLPNVDARP